MSDNENTQEESIEEEELTTEELEDAQLLENAQAAFRKIIVEKDETQKTDNTETDSDDDSNDDDNENTENEQETENNSTKSTYKSKVVEAASKKEQSLAAREKELANQAELLKKYTEIEKLKSSGNLDQMLKTLGISYGDLAEALLGGADGGETQTESPEYKALKQEIEQLKQQTKASKEEEILKQQKEYDEQYRQEVNTYIDSDNKYDIISKTERHDLVYRYIQEAVNEAQTSGVQLETQEEIEDFLEAIKVEACDKAKEELEELVNKASGSYEKKTEGNNNKPKSKTKTLSNKMSKSGGSTRRKKPADLTDDELVENALRAYREVTS